MIHAYDNNDMNIPEKVMLVQNIDLEKDARKRRMKIYNRHIRVKIAHQAMKDDQNIGLVLDKNNCWISGWLLGHVIAPQQE